MPPKKAPAASKKTEEKKKQKIVEDKTFGLKNKKGAKQQKFIQHVNKNVKQGGDPTLRKLEELKKKEKEKKEEGQKDKELLKELFKPIVEKVDKSVDPKSVVCPFFKQGVCDKGAKCKYAHDLNVSRKVEKRNIYVDSREMNEDSTDALSAAALHDGADANKPRTHIVCKYFLEAVENNKYGWFWQCPSGDKCIYRHALPEGYVLKRDQKKPEKKDEISIEDLVEKERAALGSDLTKVTYTSFLQWKRKKLAERRKEQAKKQAKKKSDFKSGKSGGLSGRDMFTLNPELGDGEVDDGDEGIDLSQLPEDAEDDPTASTEPQQVQYKSWTLEDIEREQLRGENDDPANTDGAGALQIDEQLFDGDLEDLDEDLDQLDLRD